MKSNEYPKLVRDRIVEIVSKDHHVVYKDAENDGEYIQFIEKKFYEEIEELINAESKDEIIYELSDLMELIFAYAKAHDISLEELEQKRNVKAQVKGTFDKKHILIDYEKK